MGKADHDEHGQHRMGFHLVVDDELSLRLVEPQHADEIFAAVENARETIRLWLPWTDGTQTVGDVREWAEKVQAGYGEGTNVSASIIYQGQVVGVAGFNSIERTERPDWGLSGAHAEIGYWLTPAARGQGVMTRVVKVFTDYGFTSLGLHRIVIRVEAENTNSWRVAERAGYQYEGVMRGAWRLTQEGQTRRVDYKVYAALQEEWTP